MPSLSTFLSTNPSLSSETIKLLIDGDGNVIAMTINTEGCNNINFLESLAQLVNVTINGTELVVTAAYSYTGWYGYETVPTPMVTSTLDPSECTQVYFNPDLNTRRFTYDEYNGLLGNSEELRRYRQVFEVDYKSFTSGSLAPSNLQAILDGTAVVAEVQESNYTNIGFTNARYNGTKTAITDYGTNPALSVGLFEGSSYLISVDNNYICSSSLSDRTVKEFVYTGNEEYPDSGNRIFTLEGSKALPVRNRKIWVSTNNKIIETDNDGYIANSGSAC